MLYYHSILLNRHTTKKIILTIFPKNMVMVRKGQLYLVLAA